MSASTEYAINHDYPEEVSAGANTQNYRDCYLLKCWRVADQRPTQFIKIAADPAQVNNIPMSCQDVNEHIYRCGRCDFMKASVKKTRQPACVTFPRNSVTPYALSIESLLDFLQSRSTELGQTRKT
jgi:hypothetical protein